MRPRSLLSAVPILWLLPCIVRCSPTCTDHCCRFVEAFPFKLRKLREDYSHIRDSYVSIVALVQHHLKPLAAHGAALAVGLQDLNEDLDIVLLDQSVEESFKSPFACHAMNSILDFYLATVLPTAVTEVTQGTKDLRPHMESIKQIFNQLKGDVTRCTQYFHCKEQFDIRKLNTTYTQLKSRGLYKAIGELDLLFNYMETYLASKRKRSHMASL